MERRADQIVHWIGISAGPVAVCLLIGILLRQHGTDHLLPGLVYGFGLLAMLGCSAAYNLTRASPRKDLLRRLDHAAIFVMIAGTYTPFMTNLADANRGHELLTIIWCVALAGAAMKLAFPRRLERVSIPLRRGCVVVMGTLWRGSARNGTNCGQRLRRVTGVSPSVTSKARGNGRGPPRAQSRRDSAAAAGAGPRGQRRTPLTDDASEWPPGYGRTARMAPEMAAGRTTVGTSAGVIVAAHLCLAISYLVAGALTSEG